MPLGVLGVGVSRIPFLVFMQKNKAILKPGRPAAGGGEAAGLHDPPRGQHRTPM